MALKGLKLDNSAYRISQEINLEKATGVDLTNYELLKREIAQAIIDRIVKRTMNGESAYGGSLGDYSKAYKDSLDFKAAGKSNPVDLRLSGDMLESIDIISETDETITIGFDDQLQNEKAYGHQTGMKGSSDPNRLRRPRPFFGISEKELKEEVLSRFREDIQAAKTLNELQPNQGASPLLDAQNILRDLLREEEEDL